MALELYGTKSCPYTAELREDLEWKGAEFVEYDVEEDGCQGATGVPLLVEDGRVVQVGMRGRSCYVTRG